MKLTVLNQFPQLISVLVVVLQNNGLVLIQKTDKPLIFIAGSRKNQSLKLMQNIHLKHLVFIAGKLHSKNPFFCDAASMFLKLERLNALLKHLMFGLFLIIRRCAISYFNLNR